MDLDRFADAWDTLWAIPDSVVVDPVPVPAKPAVIRRVAPAKRAEHSQRQAVACAAPAGAEACNTSASAMEIGNDSNGPSSSAECAAAEPAAATPTTSCSAPACAATSAGPVAGASVFFGDVTSLRAASSNSDCAGAQPTSSAGSTQLLSAPAPMSGRPSVSSWPELAATGEQARTAGLQQQHSTAATVQEMDSVGRAVVFAAAVTQAAEAAGDAAMHTEVASPAPPAADPHLAAVAAADVELLLCLRNGNGSGGGGGGGSRTSSTSAVDGRSAAGCAPAVVSTDADSTRAVAAAEAEAEAEATTATAPAAASGLWTAASLRSLCRSRDPRLVAEPSPAPPAAACGASGAAAPTCGSAAGSPVQLGVKAAAPAALARPLPPLPLLPPLRRAGKTTTALLLNRVRRDPGSAACSPQAAARAAATAAARAGGKVSGKRGKSSIEEWIASSRPEAATGPEPAAAAAGLAGEAMPPAMRRSPSLAADANGSGGGGSIMDDVQRALEAAEAAATAAEAAAAAAGSSLTAEARPAAPRPALTTPLWPPQRAGPGPLPPPRGRFDFRIRKRRARAHTPGASPPPPMERSPAAVVAAAVAKAAATGRRAFMDAVFASCISAEAADADAAAAGGLHLAGQKRTAADAALDGGPSAAVPLRSPSPALPVAMYTAADVEAASTAAAAAAAAARTLDARATLEEALDEWRTYRAPKVRKTPEALLRRSLMEELAGRCPTSVLDLEDVPGLPRPWIRNYGQEVLDVCRNFLHVHAVRAAARQAAAAAARARRAAAAAAAATAAAATAAAAPAQQRSQAPPLSPPLAARQAAASPAAKRQRLMAGTPRGAPPPPPPPVSVRTSDGSARWVDERSERLRRQMLGAMGLQADKPIEPQLGVAMNVTPATMAQLQQQSTPPPQQQQQQHSAATAAAPEAADAAGAGSSSEAPLVQRPRVATKAAIAARRSGAAMAAPAPTHAASAPPAPAPVSAPAPAAPKPAHPTPAATAAAAAPRIRVAVSARAARPGATTSKPRGSAAAVAAVGAAAEAALARGDGGWAPPPAGTRIRAGAALAYAPSPAVHYIRVTDLLGLLAEAGRMAEPFLEDGWELGDGRAKPAAAAEAAAPPPAAAAGAAKAPGGRKAASGTGAASDVLSGMAGMGVVPAPALAAAAAVHGLGRVSGQEHMRQLRAMVAAAMPAWEVRRVLACKALGASAQAAAVLRVTHATPRAEVRMAFRRLSLAVHPDKNKSDSAAEAFAMVSAAAGRLLGSAQR